nr:MAG TPA: hypothetical protein [Caudoviricetes sp.]
MNQLTKAEVARVYNYLLNHHRGKAHAGTRDEIRSALGIDARKFRYITHEINTSLDYPYIVATAGKMYLVDDPKECVKHILQTSHAATSLSVKASMMAWKLNKLNQLSVEDLFRLECEDEDVANQHI